MNDRFHGSRVVVERPLPHTPFGLATRRRTRLRRWILPVAVALGALTMPVGAATIPASTGRPGAATVAGSGRRPGPVTTANRHHRRPPHPRSACPWVAASAHHQGTPWALAGEVVSHMDLAEKIGFVVLVAREGYENMNRAIPQLCIPSLTLQDSPNGIAYGATGVTQLPASLGIAASFSRTLAYEYGQVEGVEARGKGIDAVQGPNLNLLRVPQSGRAFEGYGEDPYLVGQLGVANIQGIQSQTVMADAKHYTAYNQETARVILHEDVSRRALEELYLAPFAAAVRVGHVASIMCAYGALNGINDCSDPFLYKTLRTWGFTGFVRSDLGSITHPGAGFRAGLDLLKPVAPSLLRHLVDRHKISLRILDTAVRLTLAEMFRFGLVAHPRAESIARPVTSPAHALFAVRAAEASMVLLKNSGHLLPLASGIGSLGVVGVDASLRPETAGSGSAYVLAGSVVTPLAALRRTLGATTRISYAPGGVADHYLPLIARSAFASGTPLPSRPPAPPEEPGKDDVDVLRQPNVTRAVATASKAGRGASWASWRATVVPPRTGLYDISVEENGDTWLSVDGRPLLSFPGLHGRSSWSSTIHLVRHHRYRLELRWFAINGAHYPRLGWKDVSPLIASAVAIARRSPEVVVFASDFSGEGADRPSLMLPGDENALIEAVAAANPRTVVVLNTGGAVLMPWLSRVGAVLEAWYPGQGDGTATAAVLLGRVDPAGHLPITFPATTTETPVASPASFPGVDATVHYSEGLDIGYRYFDAHRLVPLFPFGFGLSYTSFHLSHLTTSEAGGLLTIRARLTNTGRRSGRDVVQAYLGFPPLAGEPPLQLRAFKGVTLGPSGSASVQLELARSAFEAYLGGRWGTVGGNYTISVGDSSAHLPLTASVAAP